MPRFTCEEARDLTVELALGTISGDDRARLLAHIADCAACRRLVDDLSEAADSLLLLAPVYEPPAGFESTVLARMKSPAGRKPRFIAIAAAMCVAAAAAAAFTLWSTSETRELGAHYQEALEEANGDYFGVRRVVTPGGTKVGNVFLYTGHTDWAFVVFEESVPRGAYRAEVKMADAGIVSLGRFEVTVDESTWGRDVSVDLGEAEALRFHAPTGEILVAKLR